MRTHDLATLQGMFPGHNAQFLSGILAHEIDLERAIEKLLSLSESALPDDFLRLPEDTEEMAQRSRQEHEDAVLAERLQRELMTHDQGHTYVGPFHAEPSVMYVASQAYVTAKKRIATASGVAKNKMHHLYLKFQTRLDAPNRKDPRSHRPLINTGDSESEDEYGGRVFHDDAPLVSYADALRKRKGN